jgi:hypothetical protein
MKKCWSGLLTLILNLFSSGVIHEDSVLIVYTVAVCFVACNFLKWHCKKKCRNDIEHLFLNICSLTLKICSWTFVLWHWTFVLEHLFLNICSLTLKTCSLTLNICSLTLNIGSLTLNICSLTLNICSLTFVLSHWRFVLYLMTSSVIHVLYLLECWVLYRVLIHVHCCFYVLWHVFSRRVQEEMQKWREVCRARQVLMSVWLFRTLLSQT